MVQTALLAYSCTFHVCFRDGVVSKRELDGSWQETMYRNRIPSKLYIIDRSQDQSIKVYKWPTFDNLSKAIVHHPQFYHSMASTV